MARDDTADRQDRNPDFGDVLHILAAGPAPDASLPVILDSVRMMLDAAGTWSVLFEEPPVLAMSGVDPDNVPPIDVWRTLSASLIDSISVNPPLAEGVELGYPTWVVGRVTIGQDVVGLLCVVFDHERGINGGNRTTLESFIDAVTVVAMNARSKARHQRLGRNQSEFMRIVSHDLRSPLTAIHGFASMLESNAVGDLNERQAHFVAKILSGIDQITSLVDNIQDAGRYDPETGFYEMQRSPCDLAEVVQRTVRSHLVPAEKPELTVSVTVAADVPIINADVNMIERAVSNLVDNALKYSPNGCAVEVGAKKEGESVIIYVKDNGLGISPEHQKRLFERHVRIPRKEHKRIKGSGLGLFIVRSVALRHGGNAWVKSAEGEGSTFFISIPLNEDNTIVGST